MKRWVSLIALVGVTACGPSGCGREPDPAPTATPTPAPTASATASSNGARSVAEETDDFLFEFSYPAEAGRIVELASLLDVGAEEAREELAADAAAGRRAARGNGFPYNKFSYTEQWKVVSDLPGWLSLSADVATYTGGAHGNFTVRSLVWDKRGEEALSGMALFASPAALEKALGDRYCEALDRERAKRRGELDADDLLDSFSECPSTEDLEVLIGSSNGRTFNRLTVYAAPYIAGPYVEGAYEIDLNVDGAILDAVRPEYREAFSARN